jgi:hypothetical protein
MKFIFPQNYNFNHKVLGIFDTSTIVLNGIWALFVFCLLNLVFSNLNVKIFLFIILVFPILLFSIIGFNHENILYVFYYIFKYMRRPKIYLYK